MNKKAFPYTQLNREQIIGRMDELAGEKQPFLFVVDYEAKRGYVIPQKKLDDAFVRFDFHTKPPITNKQIEIQWQPEAVSLQDYAPRFNHVMHHLKVGNTFLTNLTQPTLVRSDMTIRGLYDHTYAPYKLWLKDHFLVLSPESFIKITKDKISTFPMKGTIDAAIPNAEHIILHDEKEMAEHATIVDLLRNDLSMVADDVSVTRYRYVEKIKTLQKDLLQVSSEITGSVNEAYSAKPGSLLFKLLPAGSICGAPKAKTLRIIREAEGYDRGFYTGICGFFDGENLDSAVMIRFMEPAPDGLIFKSGGGITFRSDMEKEYEELIQKVYVPVY